MDLAAALLSLALRIAELQRPRISEHVTVVGSAPSVATPAAATSLGSDELGSTPYVTLDDALRSIPGFSLFRRSSSRVANPTTQGVTLRGLAASGSSRALVLADDVPLNDPVGGWVYWNRVPSVAMQEVSVMRGAAGDLRAADAIGGVVAIRTVQTSGARLLAEGGSDATGRVSIYGGRTGPDQAFSGAAELFSTDGFVITAPESRGSIDKPASSRHGSFYGALGFPTAPARPMIRVSHHEEARGNGTPAQRNGTRVTQVSGSARGRERWTARGYATTQQYEQTFSAIAGSRTSERPTSEQDVGAQAIGGAVDWGWSGASHAAVVAAAATYVDAELVETVLTVDGGRVPTTLRPSEATATVSAQVSGQRGRSSFGGGLRIERWQSTLETTNERLFVNPRLWIVHGVTDALSVRLAIQNAHRAPTLNELYRPFRVGAVITNANPSLAPERMRGVEGGASWRRGAMTARALGFWSRVSDAIANVTLSADGGTIVRQRQNAARIRAAGTELELEYRAWRSLVFTGASSWTTSVFDAGPLEGLRVPQVARVHHSVGARGTVGTLRLSGEWRHVGAQFDDDLNAFRLRPASLAAARAGWVPKRGMEVFVAVENLTDAEQDVGRTPLRTIGLPRTSRVGVRLAF